MRNANLFGITLNNLFKSDSQRVAFLLCVGFNVVCGSIGIALLTP
ncbi:TPA: DUF3265 domain-containing protein [Vibrio parahaemolyticus]|nr:DUF3265 domain-containing protein [Vibrio parahaemolyticus]